MASNSKGRTPKRADPSTIHDKFLVGYQGWFTCAGDGEPVGPGHHGWLHWFNYPIPDGGRPNMDLWPDVSEYTPSELFPAPGVKYANGEQAFLFSSRHPKTVQRHFHCMAMHGVDGAFLQRFAGQCDMEQGNEGIRKIRDEVGDRVMEAAEKEGRVFAIMYDVSGVAPDRIQRVLEHDWVHLIRRKAILDSPAYLREQGRPVVALWGFGMSDAHHSPATVRAITRFIRNNTPGGAYIMAGVPAHWRTSVMDADPNPDFVRVWMEEFDAISPWTIGRYHNEEGADRFEEEKIKGDVDLVREHNERWESQRETMRKIDYIPVIFPGSTGHNLSEGKWGWNDCPRRGGHFMWRQLYNVRRHNVRTIYGAMWDEYDEGTAFLPVVSHKRQLPVLERHRFMALDEDGFDLPPDWYMRICGFAAEGLRGDRLILGTFPSKELQDYWSSRPRYEDEVGASSRAGGSASGSGEEKGQTWEEWEKAMQSKENGDEPPPPPYSLEVEESQPQSTSSGPPPVPLERRPSTQAYAPPTTPLSTRPDPPSVNSGSRPQSFSGSSPGLSPTNVPNSPPRSPHLVPTDEFSRLGISPSLPSSPRPEHMQCGVPSHSPSPRPVSPAHSHHSHMSSHSASGLLPTTEPGFTPHFPAPSIAPPVPSGPWSQAQWPPPEWSSPSGPAAIIDQYFHRDESPQHVHTSTQHRPGYTPSYAPSYEATTSPPLLRPRPSLSHHSGPLSPTRLEYGSNDKVGGFAFPEAQVASADSSFHASRHSPYLPPSSYSATTPQSFYTGETSSFPQTAGPAPPPPPRPYDYGHASIQSEYYSPMPPEPNHSGPSASTYPGPSSPPAAHGPYYAGPGPYGTAPHPPPAHATRPPPPPRPPAGYSGSQNAYPSGSGQPGGPIGQALNLVGNVAGQGAKSQLQNLANTSTKLFNKYRR